MSKLKLPVNEQDHKKEIQMRKLSWWNMVTTSVRIAG